MTKSSQAKYRILGLVGRGQFGRVFCARDRSSEYSLVALKELEQRRFPTSQFLRELRFLISLKHTNIVSCISLDYSQNRRYLVMEYCEAGTLRNLMAENLIDGNREERSLDLNQLNQNHLNQCLNLVLEILSGLDYAHSLNIVHCDIKPENILLKLTKTGWQAKISDFGIARLGQENDKSDNNGSPGYMAPERFYGQYSHASDLYAVGIILYELLVKERPFSGNPVELMYAHLNQRLKVPDYVPDDLKTFLVKALEKLPARRFKSAKQMYEQLQSIICSDLYFEQLSHWQLSSNQSLPKSNYSGLSIVEEDLPEVIVAVGFCNQSDSLQFYSATEFLLEKRNLSSTLDPKKSCKLNQKITNLVITKNHEFVITNQSICLIINDFQDYQVLVSTDPEFHWAIADRWLGIVTVNSQNYAQIRLQIYYLANQQLSNQNNHDNFSNSNQLNSLSSSHVLDLPKLTSISSVIALLKISNNHLALVSNTNQGSNISVISRRGNLMAEFDLPVAIVKAIALNQDGKILLVTELDYLLLVDWKPYRVSRIELGYRPILLIATPWGYITSHGETNSLLNFMDSQGNYVGNFTVDGSVQAIACISNNVLVISVQFMNAQVNDQVPDHEHNHGGKLLILDLKQLELDLVF